MSKRKGKHKHKRNLKYIAYILNFVCIACATVFVIAHNDAETPANTITVQAEIHDVQYTYNYSKNRRTTPLIVFSTDDCTYYCRILTPFFSSKEEAIQEKLSLFESLEKDAGLVTIISTDERLNYFDSRYSGMRWAVGVYSDDLVLCSLDEHNDEQKEGKTIDLIIIGLWTLLSCAYLLLMVYLEKPQRRRKEKTST